MARPLHQVPTGSLVEVTNRTVDGRFLLRPSRDVNDIALGILARAGRLYRVGVCAFNFLSNHYHLLLRPADAQALRGFMTYLDTNLSKEIGRLRGCRGLWRRRYHHALVSDEPEAQLGRLRYVLSQGCKEGLVRSPKDWPGASCVEALTAGRTIRGLWFNRTAEHKARKCRKPVGKYEHAEVETLELVPMPCLEALTPQERRARCADLVRDIEAETRARIAETGKAPLGKRRILRQDPFARPAHFEPSPAPRFHAAAWEVRKGLELAYHEFRTAYRQAADDLRAGRRALFPPDCFPPPLPFTARAGP
jgi:REP element-mobilizing transposase RayT